MTKPRGSPDRRGMGAQSDFFSQTFVPSELHQQQQIAMAKLLIAAGNSPETAAAMLSLPLHLLATETAE